jgi:eukaryotic-like serine/threonine-protein kinase
MTQPSTCPSADAFQRLLRGETGPADRDALLQHLGGCQRCAEFVRRQSTALIDDLATVDVLSSAAGRGVLVEQLRSLVTVLDPEAQVSSSTQVRTEIGATRTGHGMMEPFHEPPADDPTELIQSHFAPAEDPEEMGRLGHYRIIRVLGKGGMGVVFLAEDIALRRPVALKVLKPVLAASSEAAQRFLREAQTMAALKHDNVVTVYHVGQERGVPYLTMELLEGEPLDARLRREGRLPIPEVLRLGREAALGLAAAHNRGVIHRDIKPANLWLEAHTGRVKLLDFGLARAISGDTTVTQAGTLLGTPAYMSPEQARAEPVDHRCDLFSLGCVLYQLSTGRLPFKGNDAVATLLSLVSDQPTDPMVLNPQMPLSLSALIMKLLAKNPENRPESAQKVAEALQQISHELEPPPSLASQLPTVVQTRPERRTPPPKRVSWFTVLGVFTILAALGILAWRKGEQAILFATNKGRVVLEVGDGELEVLIRGADGGELGVSHEPRLDLAPGDYLLEITARSPSGEFRSLSRPVTLKRGGEEVIDIRKAPAVREARVMHHGSQLFSVAYSPDGSRLASGSAVGTVKVWDPATGAEFFTIGKPATDERQAVHGLAFSPDSKLLAGTAGGAVTLWQATTGKVHRQLALAGELVTGVAFSPDGRYLAASGWDNAVRLWDVDTGALSSTLKADSRLGCVAFTPDGLQVAAGGDKGAVWVWDVRTAEKVLTVRGHRQGVLAVAFSPSGKRGVSADWDRQVLLWAADTGKSLLTFKGASHSIGFSPDNRWIVGGGHDQVTRLWDATSGSEVLFLRKAGQAACFGPDGKYLATAGTNGIVSLWDLSSLKNLPPGEGDH